MHTNITQKLFEFDDEIKAKRQISLLCGIDEAGRGPLAGAVFAAAVVLKDGLFIPGLNDSKKLSEQKRDGLAEMIKANAVAYAIGTASELEIDDINILNATFLAMNRAVAALGVSPQLCLIDGNRDPKTEFPTELLVKGDGISASIAAASILAKTARDRYMKLLAEKYPRYEFDKHKGYGTKLHYELLKQYGASPVHRKSFLKNL
ncbi:MAG: ribonuclease HII [Oscillospiraceae bacterium]|jgi:ribonuclease HII|nr:ribonuclease HII [Oscillospiraceae bacterium]